MSRFLSDGAKLKTVRAYGLSIRQQAARLKSVEEMREWAKGLQEAVNRGHVRMTPANMRKLNQVLNARLKALRAATLYDARGNPIVK